MFLMPIPPHRPLTYLLHLSCLLCRPDPSGSSFSFFFFLPSIITRPAACLLALTPRVDGQAGFHCTWTLQPLARAGGRDVELPLPVLRACTYVCICICICIYIHIRTCGIHWRFGLVLSQCNLPTCFVCCECAMDGILACRDGGIWRMVSCHKV